MTSRSFMIGSFDASDADVAHYRSEAIDFGSIEIGDIAPDVCTIDFDTSERLLGIKVFLELHEEPPKEGGRFKIIWQVSSREAYWYPGEHNDRFIHRMPPGIFDQTKQSITVGTPASPTRDSNEVEKFIDPAVIANVPTSFDEHDRLAIHARISEDSTVSPTAILARSTLIAFTQRPES